MTFSLLSWEVLTFFFSFFFHVSVEGGKSRGQVSQNIKRNRPFLAPFVFYLFVYSSLGVALLLNWMELVPDPVWLIWMAIIENMSCLKAVCG